MNDPVRYGQLQSEKIAEENEICRQIVREISNFGVTQRQALMVIYLMAMELENVEHMRSITKLIREIGGNEIFLIGSQGEDDGTTNA